MPQTVIVELSRLVESLCGIRPVNYWDIIYTWSGRHRSTELQSQSIRSIYIIYARCLGQLVLLPPFSETLPMARIAHIVT